MGRHVDQETKYHYVMRYLNGKSPTKLGCEINWKIKRPNKIVWEWRRKYEKYGFDGLKSKTGKTRGKGWGRTKKKPKPDYQNMTKEELIEILKIKDIFIDEINKKRARFRYSVVEKIKKKFNLSIRKICSILNVSPSWYYEGRKRPVTTANYNEKLLVDIEKIYLEYKGIYGADRIMGELIFKKGIKRNIKTVRRYMDFLGIQSIIRNPNKRNKRYKRFKKKLY